MPLASVTDVREPATLRWGNIRGGANALVDCDELADAVEKLDPIQVGLAAPREGESGGGRVAANKILPGMPTVHSSPLCSAFSSIRRRLSLSFDITEAGIWTRQLYELMFLSELALVLCSNQHEATWTSDMGQRHTPFLSLFRVLQYTHPISCTRASAASEQSRSVLADLRMYGQYISR